MANVSPNTYRVDFDRQGRVRGMFVIPAEDKPWAIVDYIEGKASEKFEGMVLVKVKRTKYMSIDSMSHWTATWVYKGFEAEATRRRMMLK